MASVALVAFVARVGFLHFGPSGFWHFGVLAFFILTFWHMGMLAFWHFGILALWRLWHVACLVAIDNNLTDQEEHTPPFRRQPLKQQHDQLLLQVPLVVSVRRSG
jgi:hypothetical protein